MRDLARSLLGTNLHHQDLKAGVYELSSICGACGSAADNENFSFDAGVLMAAMMAAISMTIGMTVFVGDELHIRQAVQEYAKLEFVGSESNYSVFATVLYKSIGCSCFTAGSLVELIGAS